MSLHVHCVRVAVLGSQLALAGRACVCWLCLAWILLACLRGVNGNLRGVVNCCEDGGVGLS